MMDLVNELYEVVRTVKGYNILRMKGTKGYYSVFVEEGKGHTKYYGFRTIKSAVKFINDVL